MKKTKVKYVTRRGEKIELKEELVEAISTMGQQEIRQIYDTRERAQQARIRAASQARAIKQGADSGIKEQANVLEWIGEGHKADEIQVELVLAEWVANHPMAAWLKGVTGVGIVISAGLLSFFDITMAPTCGHFWNFAGMNPGVKWEKGKKRPWNATLKQICLFKIGEQFVKGQRYKNDDGTVRPYYSRVFFDRKSLEIQWNDEGKNSDIAKKTKIKTGASGEEKYDSSTKGYGASTAAAKWVSGCYPGGSYRGMIDAGEEAKNNYLAEHARRNPWVYTDTPPNMKAKAVKERKKAKVAATAKGVEARAEYLLAVEVEPGEGTHMFPPAHIQARAVRWTVKLFISHFHAAWFKQHYKKDAPLPHAIDILKHAHMIEDPQDEADWYTIGES